LARFVLACNTSTLLCVGHV